ncbi:hypothetical protein RHSIM_Rhsim04G0234100 [Rhododendron simsii]|uniref:Uncharacterized protein n=1 Tax=Rhododendron simsii TaxID=118357 RepID=A0A834HCY7_RHOSS|nr:hypothetical protein RHSIM_Rhsim04G0234100 [Rhododendron simsii]
MSSLNNHTETRTLFDELRSFDKGGLFDFGHPLLNRIAESFVKAAGIGAIQAVSREAYFTLVEGETSSKSLEALVKNTGKESLQWGLVIMYHVTDAIMKATCSKMLTTTLSILGLAAGMYSGLTYGLTEARGTHDWKNSAVAGAITGMALALTTDDSSHEQMVQSAITGAAISTTAHLLAGIF